MTLTTLNLTITDPPDVLANHKQENNLSDEIGTCKISTDSQHSSLLLAPYGLSHFRFFCDLF